MPVKNDTRCTHVQVWLHLVCDVCLSPPVLCVQMSPSCSALFCDLSPSVQGHLIYLKYLQQASGPDHHSISYTPSIPQSPIIPPSLFLLSRSNQIGSFQHRVHALSRVCECVCECILGQIKVGICLSVLLPWLHMKQQLCVMIHVWNWMNMFTFAKIKCRSVSCEVMCRFSRSKKNSHICVC